MTDKQKNLFKGIGSTLKKLAPAAGGLISLLGAKEIAAVKVGAVVLKKVFGTDDPEELAPKLENATNAEILQLEALNTDMGLAEIAADISLSQEVTKRWEIDSNSDSPFTRLFRPGSAAGVLIYTAVLCPFSLYMVGTESRNELMLYWIGYWGTLATTMIGSFFVGRSSEKKATTKFNALTKIGKE